MIPSSASERVLTNVLTPATLATRTIALWSPNRYVKFLVVGSYLEFAVGVIPMDSRSNGSY